MRLPAIRLICAASLYTTPSQRLPSRREDVYAVETKKHGFWKYESIWMFEFLFIYHICQHTDNGPGTTGRE
jgi:hypothetical protein